MKKICGGFLEILLSENAAKYFHMINFAVINLSHDQKIRIKTRIYDNFFVSYDSFALLPDF